MDALSTCGPGPPEAHPAGPGQNSLHETVRNREAGPEQRAAPRLGPLHYLLYSLESFQILLDSSESFKILWWKQLLPGSRTRHRLHLQPGGRDPFIIYYRAFQQKVYLRKCLFYFRAGLIKEINFC